MIFDTHLCNIIIARFNFLNPNNPWFQRAGYQAYPIDVPIYKYWSRRKEIGCYEV